MAEQKHSATMMLDKALASPQAIAALEENPVATLRRLEAEVVQGLPAPDERTASALWLIVVSAFALVLLFCVWILGTGVTAKLEANTAYAVKGDTILTVFTTIVGFLAGLLAPSPVSSKGS